MLSGRRGSGGSLGPRATFNVLQDDAGVVVGDDVGVAVLGLVHFQVGMLPRELLARIDGLRGQGGGGVRVGISGPGTAGGGGRLTSYSWDSLRLSLALRRSVCSAMSAMGTGGWLSMPAGRADPSGTGRSLGASPGAGGGCSTV